MFVANMNKQAKHQNRIDMCDTDSSIGTEHFDKVRFNPT